ncbi:PREDICTED: uncharacterized protein LOC108774516 [Cyphomyrmex costatus]|uniref:uncharacterized protein LOC108774516 n=1 Tax=Cyphomyrmex costatus TaxID=456900 RepID=UPI0008522183|nr:PREDICTED: uncharacterized protein LOC108774516 [Cyphomyrmex costatus]
MQERVTLKKAIAIVKFSLFVIWFWPLPLGAPKSKILCIKLYQYICILLTTGVLSSIIYALVKNTNDLDVFMRSSFSLFPCGHVIGNILCHLVIYQRLQYVTFEMENFCTLIKPHEEAIVQREYVDKYSNFYGFCISLFYMSLFGLFVGPIMLDQPLPTTAEFPFDASHQPLRAITYMHQILIGLFISAHLCVNAFMALLLWLASARFKLLIEELRTITNIYDFAKCIKKHQKLIEYAGEVALTVRPFALVTVFFSTIALIIFGLVFIASTNVAQAVFEIDWYAESEYFRKNLQMVIMRSQKPILVVLPCGLPSLSLRYYASNIAFEMEYFCDSMNPHEEIVIQRYIDKCAAFYGVSVLIFYFITIAVTGIVPALLHQPFPLIVEYPFDVYHQPLKTIIYAHQTIVAFIVSGQLCLNTFVAAVLWFASAKFEIIIEELKTFTDVNKLTKCIKKHQKILEYTEEVILVARYYALTCICCSTVNLIILGVSFFINQSLILKFKYTFMILACLAEMCMFVWPAEHLIFLSNNMSQAAFDIDWYNQSSKIRKLLQIIMMRSQKVVTIGVPCITPSISFNYLTSVR